MIIRQDGTIESAGFATNVPGSGFRLTAANGGFLEVENARIRGTMSTTVFEKESVSKVGGQLYVANSTTIKSGSIVTSNCTTMSVDNVTGFTGSYNNDGEIISVKKVDNSGFSTEYMLIQSENQEMNQIVIQILVVSYLLFVGIVVLYPIFQHRFTW